MLIVTKVFCACVVQTSTSFPYEVTFTKAAGGIENVDFSSYFSLTHDNSGDGLDCADYSLIGLNVHNGDGWASADSNSL